MIEKIYFGDATTGQIIYPHDGIRLWQEKLNEIVSAVNKIEGALSDLGNLSKPFVDIAKGLRDD